MQKVKQFTISLVSALTLLTSANTYAACKDIPGRIHCLESTSSNKLHRWQTINADGEVIGPICAPADGFSYIPQKYRTNYKPGQVVTWTINQCDNAACKNPQTIVVDRFQIGYDASKDVFYSTPLDTTYQPSSYGESCTSQSQLQEGLLTDRHNK